MNSLTLANRENGVNKIFELEKEIILKDSKIEVLEFELSLQKLLYQSLKEAAMNLVRV